MKLINKTLHDVHMMDSEGNIIKTLPKAEKPIRLEPKTEIVGDLNGFPITRTVFGAVKNMPSTVVGTFLIVSRMILKAFPNRTDLLTPNETVRDEKGRVIGCKSFSKD